jgi:hypothetical protein
MAKTAHFVFGEGLWSQKRYLGGKGGIMMLINYWFQELLYLLVGLVLTMSVSIR